MNPLGSPRREDIPGPSTTSRRSEDPREPTRADLAEGEANQPAASAAPADERSTEPPEPPEPPLQPMTLFLRYGLAHVGQLSIPIAGGDPVEISLHPPKFRILLALRDALRDDTADPSVPESARGWRFPEPISRLVDGQPDVVLQHESGTVRSYISEMHRLIENTAAAMGLAESPSIFERVPRVGIRLAYSLIVRDLTGTIPP